jgi:hypothetical protein
MVETLLSTPLVREALLPFLLIFAVTFAVLQKTKILGDGKKQIDAIVALVIGLIVITFGFATNLITSLIPFLAIAIVVILVFMILYGMVFQGGQNSFTIHKGIRITVGILAALGLLIVLLVSTGAWGYLYDRFLLGDASSSLVTNAIFIVVIVAAVLIATMTGGSGSGSSGASKPKSGSD